MEKKKQEWYDATNIEQKKKDHGLYYHQNNMKATDILPYSETLKAIIPSLFKTIQNIKTIKWKTE